MKRLSDDFQAKLAQLRETVAGIAIVEDETKVAELSHDIWMRALLERMDTGGQPCASAVVRPSSAAEVSAVLAWASRTRTAVVPYGLGSGVCGAVLAEQGQVVMDLGKMDRLIAIDGDNLTATVQPGMRGSEFEAALAASGYSMGHWPQSIDVSTVGGWCATRASGQFSTLYGNIENMLLGCEVALPSGELIRIPAVPRSSTGSDLRQVFLGSEGTLGVFTELTFRIHPAAQTQLGSCYTMPSVEAGIEALRLMLRAGWTPAVTRLYDGTEAGRNFAHVQPDGKPVLLLLSEGNRARVETEAVEIAKIAQSLGGRDNGAGPVFSWLEHRNQVPEFTDLLAQGLVADTIEVAIAWSRVAELWQRVVERASKVEDMIAMSGHVSHCYTQGANIYFTLIGVKRDYAAAIALYDKIWDLTLAETHELGGTVAHHHGIGRVRKAWLAKELGPALQVQAAIKKALDPYGIMNPGALLDVE